MPGGRPSKLNAETIRKAIDYIEKYEEYEDVIPSVVGMAVALGVAERTLYNWGDKSKEFLQILQICNTHQHRALLQGGLSGALNSNICKLALGKHGYQEKVAQENTVRGQVHHHHTHEKLPETDAWLAEAIGSEEKAEDPATRTH